MAGEDNGTAAFTPPADGKALITWANKRLEDASRLDEFQAKQNLAFLQGNQWGVWDSDKKRFQNPNQRRGDPNAPVRVTVNKIAGLVERVIARLTKNVPIPEARPVTDTQSDVNAAKVGTRILDHELTARLKFQQRLVELYFWVLPLGWSFMHVRWDPKAGPVVGELDGTQIHQGEIVIDEVPAFEIRLDPNARRFRDARWLIRTVAMTKEAVYEQYGKLPDGATAAESLVTEWRMAGASAGTSDTGKVRGRSETPRPGDMVAVNQFWMLPGGRIKPEGLVFTWAGTTVLEPPKPFPYTHGRLPFIPFNLLPALGGDPAGRTWVTDLIGMQRDYNDARSREATIRRELTPKVLAPVGSIDPNRLTSRVEVISYNPIGTAPSLMLPDGRWMSQFQAAMDRVDAEMGDRAGMQDVSQGKAASSAPAAGILALQEADETKMAISAKELAVGVEDVGFQTLMLVKQFWTEERTIRTWSRDGLLEVDHFSQSDLGQQLDVHVSSESALPRSKSARTQLAVDLFAQGILTEPRDFVRMLDLPGTDFLVETLNVDSKQAEREHGHLLRMEPVEAKTWHNHMAHLATHDGFRKTEEYEHLEPDVQAWFDGHVQAHYMMAMGQMGVPTPPGTPMMGPDAGGPGGANPSGANGEYTNPMTGSPQDPLAVVSGQAPSSLAGSQVQAAHGNIGGAGNPGPVAGQSADSQNFRMGN